MDIFELILESLNTLTVNKLRTGLATLGIVIGIASVIALISLGQASQKQIQDQIQSLGSNLLTVSPGSSRGAGNVRGGIGSVSTLTLDDAKSISTSSQVNTIRNVSPEYSTRTQVVAGRNNTNTTVLGVMPAYSSVRKLNVSSGSFITQKDVEGLSKVAVIGPQVASDLFGTNNVVGKSLRINNINFTIIGISVSKGGTGFQNQDDQVWIPLTTAQKVVFGVSNISSIAMEANSPEVMTTAQDQVGYLLLSRHKINDPTKADFTIFSQNDILNTASSVTGTFTSLLSGVAAISLVVGGIGIMNIMLVTVTERTREIGLRKALGAKRKSIITQFLIESTILTGVGGLIGMVVGIFSSWVITKISSLPFAVSISSVMLAVVVSVVIGIIFGWYPARKAAKLQPIEALRYE